MSEAKNASSSWAQKPLYTSSSQKLEGVILSHMHALTHTPTVLADYPLSN